MDGEVRREISKEIQHRKTPRRKRRLQKASTGFLFDINSPFPSVSRRGWLNMFSQSIARLEWRIIERKNSRQSRILLQNFVLHWSISTTCCRGEKQTNYDAVSVMHALEILILPGKWWGQKEAKWIASPIWSGSRSVGFATKVIRTHPYIRERK